MPYLRRGFLKSANRPNHLFVGFSIAPFLAVTIVLLIIFMSPYEPMHSGISTDLATCTHAHKLPLATREDAIDITITRDGSVYFRHRKVDLEVLPNRIRDSVLNGSERRVYLKPDSRAKYSDVERVVDQVSLAGVQNLSFITN